ncbi:hypothetical protein GT370_10870 [Acidocella sp. MX-AZ03]|uniref:hypothetical protein n=1 Tax=Acidocella sp. MX-AZ03 TaxID=2697363 RepID=UPI0022DD8492|nr:hypothetical protein [Acidocella sp. MX-AZ03]WBO57816.1 hypothetical protein GT370_10870 [Acidocella sp. MX-AZ03]
MKQSLIARALAARREMQGLFAHGSYEALEADGDMAGHLIAFRRADLQHEVLTLATRLAGASWCRFRCCRLMSGAPPASRCRPGAGAMS